MFRLYNNRVKKAIFTGAAVLLFFLLFNGREACLAKIPSDPGFIQQLPMWQQINALSAWDYHTDSSNTIVAIIDTGADTWHNDLRDNIWRNTKEIPDNGVDDDRNGYVDDVNGWNFVENNNDARTSVFNASSDSVDDPGAVSHGTVLAGLVGAAGNNNLAGVGVNWQVKIMPLRAIDNTGTGEMAKVIAAIEYAVANGADVINFSFEGTTNNPSLRNALKRAYDKGVVIVAAVGNHTPIQNGDLDSQPTYPACFDSNDSENWILAVASVNNKEQLSSFSNYGSCVDITAPGENIFSSERYSPQYGYLLEFAGGWDGTSFSAPLVAGAAGLLKSLRPKWSAGQIISVLLNNVDEISAFNPGFDGKIGKGRLNIGKAAEAAALANGAVNLDGGLLWQKGNQIWQADFKQPSLGVVMAKVKSGTIVGFSSFTNEAGEPAVVLLIKRAKGYAVEAVGSNQEVLTKFNITPAKAKSIIKRAQFFASGDDPGHWLVEQYNPTGKSTIISEYNWQGKKIKEKIFFGSLLAWSAGQTERTLVLIKPAKARAKWQLEKINWDSGREVKWRTFGAGTVLDLKSLSVWNNGEEQAVVLYRQGKQTKFLTVDFASQSSFLDNIFSATKLSFARDPASGETLILPFNVKGGLFTFVNGWGRPTLQVVKLLAE